MTDIEIPLGKRTLKYRFFEMVPAFFSYGIILLPIILSLFNPLYGAIFIVGYIIYWFVRAIAMAYRTIQGHNTLEMAQRVDWRRRLDDLEDPEKAIANYHAHPHFKEWRFKQHYRNLQFVASSSQEFPKPHEVFNAVIIPFVREGRETLEPTVKAVIKSHYSAKNLILILAPEQRAGEASQKLAESLVQEYAPKMYHMESVVHPFDLPNEVVGKGGNITFAAHRLQAFLKRKNINPDNVIVTTLDADNRPHASYLANVTYEYIIDPKRHNRAYQPITLFLNNIWDAPAPMRVLATGNSFWAIINSQRQHMLRNFSSHSQGMGALIDTKFWSVRSIVEDGHQYWRSYFAFDGDYEVTPIYLPVYQDAVLDETLLKTMKSQFIQLRRWAYGASDVAYVADKGFRKDCPIPFSKVLAKFARLLESHVSWAVGPIIIAVGAWLPLIVNPDSSRSIVAHELPQIASNLQFVASVGLFITVFLAFKMLPPRPARYKRHRTFFMIAQWLIMPLTSLAYGSSAAFNSQTRLLLGKYLDKFEETVKAVKK